MNHKFKTSPIMEVVAKCLFGIEGDYPVSAKKRMVVRCAKEVKKFHDCNSLTKIKDHKLSELTTELKDTAKEYAESDQLRTRIGLVLSKYLIREDVN